MTETFDPNAHKPSATDRDELPTAYGGRNEEEPQEPGQSLGQVPDPDDSGVDSAGDRPAESGSLDGDAGEPAVRDEDEMDADAAEDIGYETPLGEREPTA